jgi:hypothetical protein
MSSRARRLGGALLLLALLSLVAAAFASADSGPPHFTKRTLHKAGISNPTPAPIAPTPFFRLTAKLSPFNSTSSASGHWEGSLVHLVVVNGQMASVPGCSITVPKAPPGKPTPPHTHTIACKAGGVPPTTVTTTGNHWLLGWRLSYSNLSSTVSGAEIRINAPTSAPVAAAPLCSHCTPGKFGHTTLTDSQAKAILAGEGQVIVSTTSNPGGEISGTIVKFTTKTASGHH